MSNIQSVNIMYSRVHIISGEVFSKILKKPSIVQKLADFHWELAEL